MAIMDPSQIPPKAGHLDPDERELFRQLKEHIDAGRFEEAQDCAEDLWRVAVDAHKKLWQGVSNALTAICASELGHLRGAREIAAKTHEMLLPYPRHVVGLDLDDLLAMMDRFVGTRRSPSCGEYPER